MRYVSSLTDYLLNAEYRDAKLRDLSEVETANTAVSLMAHRISDMNYVAAAMCYVQDAAAVTLYAIPEVNVVEVASLSVAIAILIVSTRLSEYMLDTQMEGIREAQNQKLSASNTTILKVNQQIRKARYKSPFQKFMEWLMDTWLMKFLNSNYGKAIMFLIGAIVTIASFGTAAPAVIAISSVLLSFQLAELVLGKSLGELLTQNMEDGSAKMALQMSIDVGLMVAGTASAGAAGAGKITEAATDAAASTVKVMETAKKTMESAQKAMESAQSTMNAATKALNVAKTMENTAEAAGVLEMATKTLDDATEAIKNLSQTIEKMNKVIKNASKTAEDMTDMVKTATEAVENASEAMKTTMKTVEKMTEAVGNMTQVMKSTTKTTEEMSGAIKAVEDASKAASEAVEAAKDTAKTATEAVGTASETVDTARAGMSRGDKALSTIKSGARSMASGARSIAGLGGLEHLNRIQQMILMTQKMQMRIQVFMQFSQALYNFALTEESVRNTTYAANIDAIRTKADARQEFLQMNIDNIMSDIQAQMSNLKASYERVAEVIREYGETNMSIARNLVI